MKDMSYLYRRMTTMNLESLRNEKIRELYRLNALPYQTYIGELEKGKLKFALERIQAELNSRRDQKPLF